MFVRMNVGSYKGEIRGPFHMEAARVLIARGDASPTEPIGDGGYRVIEIEPTPAAKVDDQEDGNKKKARR